MANGRPRRSIFPGLVLVTVGVILLLHQYRGFDIFHLFWHWWPLMLIFWGLIKLFERTAAGRSGDPGSARVTAGEIFLVIALLSLLGIVVGVDYTRQHGFGVDAGPWRGDNFDFELEVAPKPVPANARITIRNGRGSISVHSSDESQIRVAGKKNAKGWNETEARKLADHASVEIAANGDGYEIHPAGTGDSRLSLDLEVSVPKKSALTIRNEKGDVTVSDMATPVTIISGTGDIEVRNTSGDVSIDTHKGDIKVSDTNGNVKIAGNGGEVNVSSATGGLTLDGEFFGPITADKVAKGVRFISQRTDLTLTQLSGHLEAGSGNLEITDAPGNLSLRTNRYDVTIENAGGKVKVDNRDGNVELRFSSPPKEDIEVSNAAAGITLTLPGSASFDILADCHSCDDINSEFSAESLKKTSTESGDFHLEGKYGGGRGPKITLKTSYGSMALRRTSSDLPAPPAPPRTKAPVPPAANPATPRAKTPAPPRPEKP
jgi:DUF4097 and DUF4098 domain-containing protein YvlB